MVPLRNIASGLRSLFRRKQVDQDLDEEPRALLEMAAEENMSQGMNHQDAHRFPKSAVLSSKQPLAIKPPTNKGHTRSTLNPC
jgi:hypothetical protein